jgi:hypothetical protein
MNKDLTIWRTGGGWVSVRCFKAPPDFGVAHMTFRVNKTGRVNLHDVNRWLVGTGFKVPLRYTEYGIRRRNPDLDWPVWCLDDSIPEVSVFGSEGWSDLRDKLFASGDRHQW